MTDTIIIFYLIFFDILYLAGIINYKKLESKKIETKDKKELKVIDLALNVVFAMIVIFETIFIIRLFLHY